MAIPIYTPNGWVDDDGSGTVGTLMTAARMNLIEGGVAENSRRTRVVRVATLSNVVGPLGSVNQGNGPPPIDGVSLNDGDRVLLAGQANPAQNGVYLYSFIPAGGIAGASWALQRATDFTASADIQAGQVIFVLAGSSAGRTYTLLTSNPVMGATAIAFISSLELDGGAWTGNGPWQSAAPGPTEGIAFTAKRAGTFLLSCDCSAFQSTGNTGASIQVDVWVDGGKVGSMLLSASTSTNVRLVLPRLSANVNLTAGVHYIGFQLVQGATGATDQGSIELTRIG